MKETPGSGMHGNGNDCRFSIVVITLARDSLYAMLSSLAGVKGMEAAEVVLICQEVAGRLDRNRLHAFGFPVRATVLPPGKPYGFYRGEGVRRARGDIIVFVDDDVVIHHSQWLENLTAPLLAGRAEAVMGKVVVHKSTCIGDAISLLGYPAGGNLGFDRMWRVDSRGYTRHLSTCNAAVLRERLPDFDRLSLGTLAGEDNLLARALVRAGNRILYVDSAVVVHAARSSLQGFVRWHVLRGKSLYHVRGHVNRGLFSFRARSYAGLLVRQGPLRGLLIFSLLALSAVSQLYGYRRAASGGRS